ncbi:AAA ATPase [Allomeiothermus silvanus DSM 9946]|uniref:AAA ATPase n=1 Tax=Allomeiothermus silvanus (strain ATCC 700542 / DSM 9946 / NBRC 106475 / NCIMB 13440 / VI-R2) TaxID=526227 RepID=D7BAG9_ALLS1|nr:ATP-binding protein [Allomeiothermus silvanus]ADH62491.1 AAA ATPase [Allomeiothermus silvanus DSM 9946]
MDTHRRAVLNLAPLLEAAKGKRGQEIPTDPTLPPCPLCGAPGLAGYAFARPSQIEHDCDCAYLEPERYQGALMGAWRRHTAPRLLERDLEGFPRYRAYLEKPVEVHGGNRTAIGAVQGYQGGLLYLWGPPGVGKTHLALRLAYRLAQEGRFVRFKSELDFLAEERLAAVGEAVLPSYERLVIDDVGKSRPTPFTLERLYALFEGGSTGRYDLILTANLPPEAYARRLGDLGEAVLSRIMGGLVASVEGPDLRKA